MNSTDTCTKGHARTAESTYLWRKDEGSPIVQAVPHLPTETPRLGDGVRSEPIGSPSV